MKLVGYTSCGGCPGGNLEYCVEEMKKNGAEVVHFATGMVVGYPPCPYIDHLRNFVKQKYNIDVVVGTHPIPQKYYVTRQTLGTWNSPEWEDKIKHILTDEQTRLKYNWRKISFIFEKVHRISRARFGTRFLFIQIHCQMGERI